MSKEKKDIDIVSKEVQTMIQKGALTEVQFVKNQFFSTIFVRPKKEANKFRTIINLKRGNSYMPYIHFKMEGMKNASSDLLNQGDYMTKIDLKYAYWHIGIHQESRRFLRY